MNVSTTDDSPLEPSAEPAPRRSRAKTIVAVVVAIMSVGLFAGQYWLQYRPDRPASDELRETVISAAGDATVALLSYAPETIESDLDNAKSHLTGDFLTYYSQFTDKMLNPAAVKDKGVKTTATVVRAAPVAVDRDAAKVLVFVNQDTTTAEKPQSAISASSVLVTMTNDNGRWLISAFDPTPA